MSEYNLDPDIERFLMTDAELRKYLECEKRKHIKAILLEESKEAKPFQSEIDAWEEIEKGWWLRHNANVKGRVFKPELIIEEESIAYYLMTDGRLASRTTDLFAKVDTGKPSKRKVLENKNGEMVP